MWTTYELLDRETPFSTLALVDVLNEFVSHNW